MQLYVENNYLTIHKNVKKFKINRIIFSILQAIVYLQSMYERNQFLKYVRKRETYLVNFLKNYNVKERKLTQPNDCLLH